MERTGVANWVERYERLWRTAGTERLATLFTDDVTYRASPGEDTVRGLDALARFWDAERDGPDEQFTLEYEIVAVDGPVGVVRARVRYAQGDEWLDLWVIRFDTDGRCTDFEEWPVAVRDNRGHG